jgi:hypothetical protein
MQIVDPRARFHGWEAARLAPLPSLAGATIYLLDNEKLGAREVLQSLGAAMVELLGAAEVHLRRKRPPVPSPDSLIAEISREADMTIIGSAD